MDTDFLDWALADFSGYVAADELYDGPFCILSAVDNRCYKRILYEVLDHAPDHDEWSGSKERLPSPSSPRSGRARLRHPAPQNDRFATISARYAQSSLRVADSASGVPGTGPIGWNSSATVGLTIYAISGSLQHEIG